jgi:hypothetical protein
MTKIILLFILISVAHIAALGQNKINDSLVRQLDTVLIEDQKYREQIASTESRYGAQSKELRDLYKIMKEKDSFNLVKVEAIIDKFGWLGPDIVGNHGNHTLFMVIQHANLVVQKKYLPIIRIAEKNGNATGRDLALLEDRVAVYQGKKQIYGTQVATNIKTNEKFVLPIDDPENVDKRRAEAGLQPLAIYLSQWQIKWDIEQYKKDLPRLEALLETLVKEYNH